MAQAAAKTTPTIHHLGLRHYQPTWERMQAFTHARQADTEDQIWLLQHHPIFTQGTSCHTGLRPADNNNDSEIPLLHTDRGGQITYHGPGQLIAYLLLDLKRLGRGAKSLVCGIEQTLIDLLAAYAVTATRRPGAPGVYVDGAKIAALGLRIRRGCCFHGVSLNVDMDLHPYRRIDPCGYRDLPVTQLSDHATSVDISAVEEELARRLQDEFSQPA